MPRYAALTLCITFISYLFITEYKRKPDTSYALWIPLIWFMILASKPVSLWFGLDSSSILEEGSPLDRSIYLFLMTVGVFILLRRKINWSVVLTNNIAIILFLLYCSLSILWSDYPFVSFKRWIKTLGNFIMVLIILTESNPAEAVKTLIRRCAYVLIPLSITFIKYFPDIGRSYDRWLYTPFYRGVTENKNALGALCMVCGCIFFWILITAWRKKEFSITSRETFIPFMFLSMSIWLLWLAHSATAVVTFILIAGILIWLNLPALKTKAGLLTASILGIALVTFFSSTILQSIASALGRDSTLSGRTRLWEKLFTLVKNPLVGSGYESFWIKNSTADILSEYYVHFTQAHNGYVEIYLNIGWIGLLLLMIVLFRTYFDILKSLKTDNEYAIFRFSFFFTIMVFNITESSFYGLHPLWFIFMLVVFNISPVRQYQTSSVNMKYQQRHA